MSGKNLFFWTLVSENMEIHRGTVGISSTFISRLSSTN
jgi:hypothetical protein